MWSDFLKHIKVLITRQQLILPKIFISYAWEGDAAATNWLQQRLICLRDDLQLLGFIVFLDISSMQGNITMQMQQHLHESDIILPICTPNYFRRVANPATNVSYEYQQMLAKLTRQPHCVQPLWLAGEFRTAVPEKLYKIPPEGFNILIRDWRDPLLHEWQFASLDNPLGLLPTLLGDRCRLGQPLGTHYQTHWRDYCQLRYATHSPASLLDNLRHKMRELHALETTYQQTKAYYISSGIRQSQQGDVVSDVQATLAKIVAECQTANGQVHWLLGDSGTGKTTALLKLEELQ